MENDIEQKVDEITSIIVTDNYKNKLTYAFDAETNTITYKVEKIWEDM